MTNSTFIFGFITLTDRQSINQSLNCERGSIEIEHFSTTSIEKSYAVDIEILIHFVTDRSTTILPPPPRCGILNHFHCDRSIKVTKYAYLVCLQLLTALPVEVDLPDYFLILMSVLCRRQAVDHSYSVLLYPV